MPSKLDTLWESFPSNFTIPEWFLSEVQTMAPLAITEGEVCKEG